METSSSDKRKIHNSGITMKATKEAEGVKKTSDKRQTKVKVVIRVRPPLAADSRVCVGVAGSKVEIFNHRNIRENLQYEFSSVYDSSSGQKEIFEGCVKPLLSHAVNGENVSIFAYGPTGAGKTYTMLGTEGDPGMIPRVIRTLFHMLGPSSTSSTSTSSKATRASMGTSQTHTVSFSYLEIYNEKVQDLLNPSETDLPIREDSMHNIFVAGLTQKVIHSFKDFQNLFGPASNNRTVASTKLNERSSRSHCIVQLQVDTRRGAKMFRGKIYLVDLAGSEDNRRTGNSGLRLKESGAINKSLFVLGEVVDAINNHLPRIPYRNSKLTRLLQDSIGGSCHSVMVTNLAPEETYYYDTYCTLNFATKSRKIINTNTNTVSIDRPPEPTSKVLKRTHSDSQMSTQGSGLKRPKLSPKTATSAVEPHITPGDNSTAVPPIVPLVIQRQDKLEQTVKGCMKKMEDLVQQLNIKASSSSSFSSNKKHHPSTNSTSTKPDPTMAEIQRQLSEVQAQLKEIQQQQQQQQHKSEQKSTESKSQQKSSDSKSQPKSSELKSQPKSSESKSQDGGDKSSSSSVSSSLSSSSSVLNGEGKKGERRRSLRKAVLSSAVTSFDSVLKDKTNTQSSRTTAPVPPAGGKGGLVMEGELSCSPLFLQPLNPNRFRQKDFKSTALEAGKTSKTSCTPHKIKADAADFSDKQKERNEEILEVLNTAPVRRLQELHTVGVKRARLIYDWRETHGHFDSFEQLKQIPGFTANYVHSLLERNFILTEA